MNALQELIADHCRTSGETISDVAARGGLSRQTVSAIAHRDDPGAIPRRGTLVKPAVALKLSLEVIERAAAMAASQVNGDELWDLRLDVLLDHARRLDDARLQVLLATARALDAS